MTAQNIKISRDLGNDVLYVLKNSIDTKLVTNIIINETTTLRLIKGTNEIVGFTIDEFSKICPEWKDQADYALMEYFDEILAVVNDSCKRRLTQAASSAFSA